MIQEIAAVVLMVVGLAGLIAHTAWIDRTDRRLAALEKRQAGKTEVGS